jgi:hypothetical protein
MLGFVLYEYLYLRRLFFRLKLIFSKFELLDDSKKDTLDYKKINI